jgi:hypothetical protein
MSDISLSPPSFERKLTPISTPKPTHDSRDSPSSSPSPSTASSAASTPSNSHTSPIHHDPWANAMLKDVMTTMNAPTGQKWISPKWL